MKLEQHNVDYARCKVQDIQSAKLCKVLNHAKCKIRQVKVNPMLCKDLSAKGAKPDIYYRRKFTTLRIA